MSSTRIGKIGRLPKHIRDDLGRRIEDGEQGKELVKRLNRLPDVKRVLKDYFGGRPITEQNLSEWKQGGHQDWLRHQETRHFVQHLHEKAGELKAYYEDDEWFTEVDSSEDLAVMLGAELARLTEILLKTTDNPQERIRWVLKALHELSQLRRHNHRAARLERDKLLWQREEEKLDKWAEGAELRKLKHDILAPIWAQGEVNDLANVFGGGEAGRKIAEFIVEVQHEMPQGSLSRKQPPKPAKPNPTESDLIQPNPTKNCSAAPEQTDL
ncbi:MAG: hypothetical protein ACLPYZ_00025 [Limisphaerales bacterium]